MSTDKQSARGITWGGVQIGHRTESRPLRHRKDTKTEASGFKDRAGTGRGQEGL